MSKALSPCKVQIVLAKFIGGVQFENEIRLVLLVVAARDTPQGVQFITQLAAQLVHERLVGSCACSSAIGEYLLQSDFVLLIKVASTTSNLPVVRNMKGHFTVNSHVLKL